MADIEIGKDNSGIVNRGNNNTIIQYSTIQLWNEKNLNETTRC